MTALPHYRAALPQYDEHYVLGCVCVCVLSCVWEGFFFAVVTLGSCMLRAGKRESISGRKEEEEEEEEEFFCEFREN